MRFFVSRAAAIVAAAIALPAGAVDAGPDAALREVVGGGAVEESELDAGSGREESDAGPRLVDAGGIEDGGGDDREPGIPPQRRPEVRLEVEPRSGSIGDPISWKVSVRRRVGDRVHLSSGADFGPFEIQSKRRESGAAEDGWVVETLEVTLVAFETGEHELPAQTLTAVDDRGRIARLETPAATVEIRSLLANEPNPELKPDSGPGVAVYEKDYTLLYVLGAVAAALVIALLTLLGRWLWSRRRPRRGPPPAPPRPPEEIALEKLYRLRDAGYLRQNLRKEFHVLLSEAFREYLGNRYGFYALESASEEILALLREGRVEPGSELYGRIEELLQETDLVKFAKHVPDDEDSERMLDQAIGLVSATTPRSTAEGEGGEGGGEGRDE
jgi:hypothetical protein